MQTVDWTHLSFTLLTMSCLVVLCHPQVLRDDSVCLSVSDGSLLPVLAHMLGASKVVCDSVSLTGCIESTLPDFKAELLSRPSSRFTHWNTPECPSSSLNR